jgi:hypothetical protein
VHVGMPVATTPGDHARFRTEAFYAAYPGLLSLLPWMAIMENMCYDHRLED